MNGTSTLAWRHAKRELRALFRTVWVRTPAAGVVEISRIPDGCAELVWCEGRLLVFGPDVLPVSTELSTAVPVVGLRFQPGAAARWLQTSACELVGLCTELDAFDAMGAPDLYTAIGGSADPQVILSRLEQALLPTMTPERLLPPCMNMVMQLLLQIGSKTEFIHALRCAFDMSERTVRRESVRVFGYGPKMLERIFRVQRFLGLARMKPATLAHHAAVAGFSDQAHMTREVRAITGITPRQLVRSA